MDGAANWRPTQGHGPAAIADAGGVDPNAAAPAEGDWRTQLQPEERNRIVNMIMETLKKHLTVSVPEGLSEIHKIVVRFEEKIYTAAINQSDYLRKISLKMVSMESQTKTQQNPPGPEMSTSRSIEVSNRIRKRAREAAESKAMDGAANWHPTLGDGPAAIADADGVDPNLAAPAGGDWRTQLQPEERNRIVNMIMETLKKHLPVSVPEGLGELHKIAVRFEEKIYTAAINQSDYLRKISLKILSMESLTNTQQNPGNAQMISNQNPPGPASADSTAQTGLPGTGDWQEELYQMIKSLKDQYFVELNDLYNKISIKIQHIDNHMPSQKSAEHYEKMKSFKGMLECTLHFLQVNKSSIQPGFRGKIPIYERQILSILSSQRRKPVQAPALQTFQQSASVDSTAQTGHPGAGDWQEELYQMIKSLKDQYFVELNDLYNKISIKIQHIDNHMPSQKSAEHYEKMKSFKGMLEHTLHFLQVNKSSIQPGFRGKIPIYERQILSILSSQRRKPVQAPGPQTFQQSASVDSIAQTGHPGAGDLQEELYEMIKSLKDQYFVELNYLYNKISNKIQHIDNHMPSEKSAEQYEKMKSFKGMLERTLHFLQVNKSSIQPGFREKIPIYERQILSILSSQRRKPVQAPGLQTFQQCGGQSKHQGLQQHDSHTDQKPQASLPSDCMNKGVLAAKEEDKEVEMPFLQTRWPFQ